MRFLFLTTILVTSFSCIQVPVEKSVALSEGGFVENVGVPGVLVEKIKHRKQVIVYIDKSSNEFDTIEIWIKKESGGDFVLDGVIESNEE